MSQQPPTLNAAPQVERRSDNRAPAPQLTPPRPKAKQVSPAPRRRSSPSDRRAQGRRRVTVDREVAGHQVHGSLPEALQDVGRKGPVGGRRLHRCLPPHRSSPPTGGSP